MKLFPSPHKLVAYAGALALVGVTAYGTSLPVSAEWDSTALETTVATQSEQIKDHDSRIKNVESKLDAHTEAIATLSGHVEALQASTPAASNSPAENRATEPNLATPVATPKPRKEVNVEHGWVIVPNIAFPDTVYVFTPELPNGGVGLYAADRIHFDDGTVELWRTINGARVNKLAS